MSNKVLDKDIVTSGGGAATIIFPAKPNFAWKVNHLAGAMDLQADIEILDGANIIYSVTNGAGGFDLPLNGNWFSTKGNTLTCRITNSTTACKIYASVEFN